MMDPNAMVELRVPYKDNGFHHDADDRRDQAEEHPWHKLFEKYWEKSSVSGIPFITTTRYTVVRIIWILLLIVACVGMTLHLSYLCAQYFSYKKQSKIDLDFENLMFPAITVCNSNPIRMSQVPYSSKRIQKLVEKFNPAKLQKAVDEWKNKQNPELPGNLVLGVGSPPSSSGNFFDDFDVSSFLDADDSETSDELQDEFYDPVDGNTTQNVSSLPLPPPAISQLPQASADDLFGQEFPETWEAEAERSSFTLVESYLHFLFSSQSADVRQLTGHQIDDMLIQCSYDGRKCQTSLFKSDASSEYGNCFTLEHDKFVAKQSGPRSGLEMILYVELDEYIKGITNDQGLQIVIHEPGTLPFPADRGIAIGAGTNTYIGLKMTEINRLDEPHGKCTPIDAYEKSHGIKYTRQICQKLCLVQKNWDTCRCFDTSTVLLNKLGNLPPDIPPCFTEEEKACIQTQKHLFHKNNKDCKCENPCQEIEYKKMISSRQWPQPDFAKVIVSSVCSRSPFGPCEHLVNKSGDELRNEFVRLSIFYEDLNYERLEENPDYEGSQFLSDIGGTIGLWIGLSLLSLFEIIHLIVHIFITYFFPHWKLSFSKKYKYKQGP